MILTLTGIAIIGLLCGGIGFVAGWIRGFLTGLRTEKDQVAAVEEGLRDLSPLEPRKKLQISHSKREQTEMRQLADILPVPDIRRTLEERNRGQE